MEIDVAELHAAHGNGLHHSVKVLHVLQPRRLALERRRVAGLLARDLVAQRAQHDRALRPVALLHLERRHRHAHEILRMRIQHPRLQHAARRIELELQVELVRAHLHELATHQRLVRMARAVAVARMVVPVGVRRLGVERVLAAVGHDFAGFLAAAGEQQGAEREGDDHAGDDHAHQLAPRSAPVNRPHIPHP